MNGSVRRTLITMILAAAALLGASAQNVEQLTQPTARLIRSSVWSLDTLTLDSLYEYWNAYVEAHPKDEQAWRNLFEVNRERSVRFWQRAAESKAYKERTNVVGRMEEAIPGSYTFYYCAYEGYYTKHVGVPYDGAAYARVRNEYAERAIEILPADASAYDYEGWISHLLMQKTRRSSPVCSPATSTAGCTLPRHCNTTSTNCRAWTKEPSTSEPAKAISLAN